MFHKKLAVVMLTVFGLNGAYVQAKGWFTTTESENHQAHQAHWGYQGEMGPEHWGDLSAETAVCKLGKNQSPIDITSSTKADLPALKFDYQPLPLEIENNGHTIKIHAKGVGTLTIGSETYQLQQFHAHAPAEEAINGKHADMVIHLVHANAQNQMAVVALFLNASTDAKAANPVIDTLWKKIPQQPGKPETHEGIKVDILSLLPKNLHYFTYEGSLTTPPCTEGVKWIVLKDPVTISTPELETFRQVYPHNVRPVQPLGGRVVTSSD